MLRVGRILVAKSPGILGRKPFPTILKSAGSPNEVKHYGSGTKIYIGGSHGGEEARAAEIVSEKIAYSIATKIGKKVPGVPSGAPAPTEDHREEFRKFKETQAKFQKDDGLPVFLKAGMRDRALYLSTLALAVLGVAMQFKFYYSLG
uniref:Uncharacterized protein n=1 Tax=Phlebotomus papatasi TaxID=29031 RepID=A0A1B0DMS6_PHLPP